MDNLDGISDNAKDADAFLCNLESYPIKTRRIILRYYATHSNWRIRSDSAEALGLCGKRSDFHCLSLLCKDPSWIVRCSAVTSLVLLFQKRALGVALDLVRNDRSPFVRRYAAVSLADLNVQSIEDVLIEQETQDLDDRARVGILYSLIAKGHPSFWPKLIAMLRSSDPLLLRAALSLVRELIGITNVDANTYKQIHSCAESIAQSNPMDSIKESAIGIIDEMARSGFTEDINS